jgi:hypothetical protein
MVRVDFTRLSVIENKTLRVDLTYMFVKTTRMRVVRKKTTTTQKKQ